jgi:orotate phosphoribosyltransferase
MVSIFNYRFAAAAKAFEEANVEVFSLTDYPALLEVAGKKGMIQA